jgi:hypothetical protein
MRPLICLIRGASGLLSVNAVSREWTSNPPLPDAFIPSVTFLAHELDLHNYSHFRMERVLHGIAR